MTISEIKLNNGKAKWAEGRTVSSETGLDPETEIEFIGTQSRWTGTEYKNYLYKIIETDHVLIIRRNDGPIDNLCWDNVRIEKNYFETQREYGRSCIEAARKTCMPIQIALAVGPELIEEFAKLYERVRPDRGNRGKIIPYLLDDKAKWELSCSIGRRKEAILELIPDMSQDLKKRMQDMGQLNTTRIAEFLADIGG